MINELLRTLAHLECKVQAKMAGRALAGRAHRLHGEALAVRTPDWQRESTVSAAGRACRRAFGSIYDSRRML